MLEVAVKPGDDGHAARSCNDPITLHVVVYEWVTWLEHSHFIRKVGPIST